MRISVLLAACVALFATPSFAQQAPAERSIVIVTPGVSLNAGLADFAKAFTAQTGIKVNVRSAGMGRILETIKTDAAAPDVVFLPPNLMDQLDQEKGVRANSRTPIGRVEIGLAVSVVYSNPTGGGSMQATMIDNLMKRPEFAGVKKKFSPYGEGGQALARGEAQMALQLVCEILNHPDALANAGPLPAELQAWIDVQTAVSTRSTHPAEAEQFIKYITQPGSYALWYAKGMNPVSPPAPAKRGR
jgi:ABC-type molybdate transport system substrate-binding protein